MSEQRRLLAEMVERLFQDASSEVAAVATGWNQPLWEQVEELGIPLLMASEEAGGLNGGWEDAIVVLQALGRHSVALPVAEAMLAVRLLSSAGMALPAGKCSVAPRTEGSLTHDMQTGTWRFSGTAYGVPWGVSVDHIVAVISEQNEARVVLLPCEAAHDVLGKQNLAGEPRDTLSFEHVEVLVSPSSAMEAGHLWDFCALLRVGQIAGALETALSMSVQYAQERSQFGKPIGKFQAVQQQLALFGNAAAAVACAARAACRAADRMVPEFEIAAAKLRANIAVNASTAIAHQVHAAIGFTHEYDLRHSTQRLWSWRTEFGNDRFWSERLGGAIAAGGADTFWSGITARGDLVAAPATAS